MIKFLCFDLMKTEVIFYFLRDNKLIYKIMVLIFVCEFQKHETAFDLFKSSSIVYGFCFVFRVQTYSRICDKFQLYFLTKKNNNNIRVHGQV
jgi:hypothetical protein